MGANESTTTGGRAPQPADVAVMERELDAALAGVGRVVFVTGPRGSGRTALLHGFAEAATRRRLRVTAGACGGDARGSVWATLAERAARRGRVRRVATSVLPEWVAVVPVVGKLMAALLATLIAVRRGRGESEAAAPPTTAVGAVRALLDGPDAPSVVLVDDLDLGTAGDLAGAAALIRRLPHERRLLVASCRPESELPDAVRDLMLEADRLGCCARLRLEARGHGAAGLGGLAAIAPADRELLARVAADGVFRAAELAARAGLAELEVEDRLAALARAGILEYRGTEGAGDEATSVYAFASPKLAAALTGGAD